MKNVASYYTHRQRSANEAITEADKVCGRNNYIDGQSLRMKQLHRQTKVWCTYRDGQSLWTKQLLADKSLRMKQLHNSVVNLSWAGEVCYLLVISSS